MNKHNLSNEVVSTIRAAGETIANMKGERAISSRNAERVKYTCYFLYSIKANKFLVAISDDWDNTNYSLDSGSECPLFDTIEQAIEWWKNTYYDNAYYNCGHNMTKRGLKTLSEHDIDAPMMAYDGYDEALGFDYGECDDCDDVFDEFSEDCIVVGRQARVELEF